VFDPQSPRHVAPEPAAAIARSVGPFAANREIKRPFSPTINLSLSRLVVNRTSVW
jgi:hypothetical protein